MYACLYYNRIGNWPSDWSIVISQVETQGYQVNSWHLLPLFIPLLDLWWGSALFLLFILSFSLSFWVWTHSFLFNLFGLPHLFISLFHGTFPPLHFTTRSSTLLSSSFHYSIPSISSIIPFLLSLLIPSFSLPPLSFPLSLSHSLLRPRLSMSLSFYVPSPPLSAPSPTLSLSLSPSLSLTLAVSLSSLFPPPSLSPAFYSAAPLTSAGLIPIMQSLCPEGQRDEFGFLQYKNSTWVSVTQRVAHLSHAASHSG